MGKSTGNKPGDNGVEKMKEILLVNPTRKKRARKTTGKKTTRKRPRKRTARSAAANPRRKVARPRKRTRKTIAAKTAVKGVKTMAKKKRSTKRRSYKRNPSVRAAFGGLSIQTALKTILPIQIGMFSAKWAAKRFGEFGATETDPESWNWASYLKGALGALGGATIMNLIKPGMGQKALEGGLNLMVFKVIENELVTKSDFAVQQLGQAPNQIVLDETGSPAMLGEYGELVPLDESYRVIPETSGYGESLEPVGPLGDVLSPPGRLGADPVAEAYYRAFRQ